MKQTLLFLFFITATFFVKGQDIVKPNIVIFYADDLGWQDTEINDIDEPTPWETPNIVKLAKDGLNITNGYSPAPTCAPSRCALLTGLHPTKTTITHVAGGKLPKPENKKTIYMPPHFPEGLSADHFTIAEALKMNGYKTGHVGKWHVGSQKHQKSTNQGFDFAHESRGAHKGGQRLTSFSTHDKDDEFRLSDEKYPPYTKKHPEGISYPYDNVTENALKFIKESKNEPFFLYLAHWMVHTPIHTRNRALLEHYCDKLGIEFPKENIPIKTGGQTNPFYGSMVTTLDWSLGRVVELLKKTDDPRNPGKKLYETTYIFFSSDNGGCEKSSGEIITDNFPLDQGKKYAQEGGVRVPLLIAGPNISKGKVYDGLVNQLDFYPTILNLTDSKIPAKYESDLDGLNLSGVLHNKDKDIKDKNGKVREDLWWHFPHNKETQMQSAIRSGDYKLYKNHVKGNYELYRLYKDGERADLEEKFDIAKTSPKVVKDLSARLEKYLKDYDAKFPYKDPTRAKGADKIKAASIPVIASDSYNNKSKEYTVKLEAGKSKVIEAYALVSYQSIKAKKKKNGKTRKIKGQYERLPITFSKNNLQFTLEVPDEATQYGIILIDENRFIVKSEFHANN